jgi:hypothetical protein
MEINSVSLEEALVVLGQLLADRGYYQGLTIHLAARFDQICFKLYATVDQGPRSKHFADLITLKPSADELEQAKSWCMSHDVSVTFETEINRALESINASSR